MIRVVVIVTGRPAWFYALFVADMIDDEVEAVVSTVQLRLILHLCIIVILLCFAS